MSAHVVHVKQAPYDVYVGRPSPWGNPFEIGRDGTRAEVIQKFLEWFISPEQAELRERALQELRGKVLACWCAPRACHADVLAEFVNSERRR